METQHTIGYFIYAKKISVVSLIFDLTYQYIKTTVDSIVSKSRNLA